jgi:hypothetical protein
MRESGSTVRMLAALRVLGTHCKLGKTATPEDLENVRWWAGDETLSPPEAATIVIQRELQRNGTVTDRATRPAMPPSPSEHVNFTTSATKAASTPVPESVGL